MTTFRTFASGSSGNAALLVSGGVRLLIDIGISRRRVCQSLADAGVSPEELTAIALTHEHVDHVSGLGMYIKKYSTPILCSPAAGRQLDYRMERVGGFLRPLKMGERLGLGEGVSLTLHPTSHDSPGSAAVRVETPDGVLAVLTDTGIIPEETWDALLGADILLLESNHDVEMVRAGRYPYYLKQRVLGPEGHLSNADAAGYAAASVRAGTRTVLLAHLSEENNIPALAQRVVENAVASTGLPVRITVVPRKTASEVFTMEKQSCAV